MIEREIPSLLPFDPDHVIWTTLHHPLCNTTAHHITSHPSSPHDLGCIPDDHEYPFHPVPLPPLDSTVYKGPAGSAAYSDCGTEPKNSCPVVLYLYVHLTLASTDSPTSVCSYRLAHIELHFRRCSLLPPVLLRFLRMGLHILIYSSSK